MAAQGYMIHSLKGVYLGKVQFSSLLPGGLCGKLPHINIVERQFIHRQLLWPELQAHDLVFVMVFPNF